jgi:hypothetical protein
MAMHRAADRGALAETHHFVRRPLRQSIDPGVILYLPVARES